MNSRTFETNNKLAELSEDFKCPHSESEVRKRTLSNDSIQYIHQCLRCGISVGRAISKKLIQLEYEKIESIRKFDEKINLNWNKEYQTRKQIILGSDHVGNQKDLSNFWEWYSDYLESPEWKEKRRKVLLRANDICEGCGDKKATEIHHLSYKHKGKEFLFELVALCQHCHESIHREHLNKDINEIKIL